MITLYDYELSATSYAVRLLLAVLQLPHERIEIDVHPGREHESAWFLELNPLGQLPVIDDGGPMTSDLALRLARCFGTSPQFWLGLQTAYDLAIAQAQFGAEIEAKVRPLAA